MTIDRSRPHFALQLADGALMATVSTLDENAVLTTAIIFFSDHDTQVMRDFLADKDGVLTGGGCFITKLDEDTCSI